MLKTNKEVKLIKVSIHQFLPEWPIPLHNFNAFDSYKKSYYLSTG